MPEVDQVIGNVVEENDSALADLAPPCFEVAGDGFVRVISVEVEEIDLLVSEPAGRLVEGGLDQRGETGMMRVIVAPQVGENLGTGTATSDIAWPRFDVASASRNKECCDRLTKRAGRSADRGSELDDDAGAKRRAEP